MKRSDFEQNPKDPHQWFYNYEVGTRGQPGHHAFRFSVRKMDGRLDIAIRAKIYGDPTPEDWDKVIRISNEFLKKEVVAKEKEVG